MLMNEVEKSTTRIDSLKQCFQEKIDKILESIQSIAPDDARVLNLLFA